MVISFLKFQESISSIFMIKSLKHSLQSSISDPFDCSQSKNISVALIQIRKTYLCLISSHCFIIDKFDSMIQKSNKMSLNILKSPLQKAKNTLFPILRYNYQQNSPYSDLIRGSKFFFSSESVASIRNISKGTNYPAGRYQAEQLMRYENYSFKKLSNQHFDEALSLLSLEFAAQQPLTNAYYRKFAILENQKLDTWRQFWKDWLQDSCTNNISVAIIDQASNGALVGVSVAKDIHFQPEGFDQQYMSSMNFIKPVIELQMQMLKSVDLHLAKEISKINHVSDIWGVAIDKRHMGKRLLGMMMQLNERLAIEQNYKYSFCYGTNFKTQKSLQRLGYQLIGKADAAKFESDGIHVFSEVDEEQRYPSIWLKPLSVK